MKRTDEDVLVTLTPAPSDLNSFFFCLRCIYRLVLFTNPIYFFGFNINREIIFGVGKCLFIFRFNKNGTCSIFGV